MLDAIRSAIHEARVEIGLSEQINLPQPVTSDGITSLSSSAKRESVTAGGIRIQQTLANGGRHHALKASRRPLPHRQKFEIVDLVLRQRLLSGLIGAKNRFQEFVTRPQQITAANALFELTLRSPSRPKATFLAKDQARDEQPRASQHNDRSSGESGKRGAEHDATRAAHTPDRGGQTRHHFQIVSPEPRGGGRNQ